MLFFRGLSAGQFAGSTDVQLSVFVVACLGGPNWRSVRCAAVFSLRPGRVAVAVADVLAVASRFGAVTDHGRLGRRRRADGAVPVLPARTSTRSRTLPLCEQYISAETRRGAQAVVAHLGVVGVLYAVYRWVVGDPGNVKTPAEWRGLDETVTIWTQPPAGRDYRTGARVLSNSPRPAQRVEGPPALGVRVGQRACRCPAGRRPAGRLRQRRAWATVRPQAGVGHRGLAAGEPARRVGPPPQWPRSPDRPLWGCAGRGQ